MARIRTVKPEFWTDEKVVECSIPARLLFIGLFNFANDMGCMERSPKRIKMQIFPADVIDCEPLLVELITHGLLTEYSVNGSNYLQIKGFSKHQKINRPSASKIPLPLGFNESVAAVNADSQPPHEQLNEDSLNVHGGLTDGREKEGKGKGINTERNIHADDFCPPVDNSAEQFVAPLGKFPISTNWKPSDDFVRQAALWGINLGTEPGYQPEELQQFRDYWICENKVKHQQQWEQTFAQSLRTSRVVRKPPASDRRGATFAISEPDKEIPPGFRG